MQASRTLPLSIASPRRLLAEDDFAYLGHYDVVDGMTEAGLGVGLTHRYVGGQLRLIYFNLRGGPTYTIREAALPASFGQTCTNLPLWPNIWNGVNLTSGRKHGLWWEAGENRLWTNCCIDYPSAAYLYSTSSISTRRVSDANAVSDWHGYWGFQGVSHRAHYGGVRAVPQWFQDAEGVGPYVSGFGGYTSLMSQGLTPSLGPFLAFFHDPHGIHPEEPIDQQNGGMPASAFKIGADHRSGTGGSDWFPNYDARTKDRGVRRTTTVTNWFDGADVRNNPSTRPTYPTDFNPAARWWYGDGGGPAPNDPDGFSRFCWGDIVGGVEWIDDDAGSRAAHGIVAVASLRNGHVWYQSSDLRFDDGEYEIHVYDPADVAAVLAGSLAGYNLRPRAAWSIRQHLAGLPGSGGGSGQNVRHVSGTTFDPLTGRLYLGGYGIPNGTNAVKARIYVFQVGGGA